MALRAEDGSAGDADYGAIGRDYSRYRRPEPAIGALIHAALGPAGRVLNVGAGAGSYEPVGCDVTAVEPSASMRALRPAHLASAVDAVAESLPFADDAFDASMAVFTVHQWGNLEAGLREMRRVTRGPVVVLSCAPDLVERFWMVDYAPDVLAVEARRYPPLERIAGLLGGAAQIERVPIPLHCTDGFSEAYYGRPECFLNPGARLANSAWSFVEAARRETSLDRLRGDLESGRWDAQYGYLRRQPAFEGSLYRIVSRP
jgi:hypothetical protein